MHQIFKNRSLLIRVLIFSVLFIAISGWFGSWIISTPLLYPFYFYIYGNLGKVLLFIFISLVIVVREKLNTIHIPKYEYKNLFYLFLALLISPIFFPIAHELQKYSHFSENILLAVLAHAIILIIPLLLAIGIFGFTFLENFTKEYKKELFMCLTIALFSYMAIFYVWTLWPYLSNLVLQCVSYLFRLTFDNVVIFPPRTLYVEKFAVTIDQACSGLESFLLFTGMSGLILYVDRKRLNIRNFSAFYIFGMLGAFFVNVLRIYTIIWSGLIISPDIAAKMFHTYLGMIFFLLYFIILLKITYNRLHRTTS